MPEEIRMELEREQALLERLESAYQDLPAGCIERKSRNGHEYLFLKQVRDGVRTRVALSGRPDEDAVIADVAYRKGITRAMPVLRKNISACMMFLKHFRVYDPYAMTEKGAPDPRLFLDGDTCDNEWAAAPCRRNPYYMNEYKYETKKGESVRSKSEMMIADVLFDLGLEYRSDCGLTVGGATMYPDFQILRRNDHRVILWEHNGLLNNSEYVRRSYEKLERYARAGYVIGKNLIVTSETEQSPLNRSVIMKKIEEYGLG